MIRQPFLLISLEKQFPPTLAENYIIFSYGSQAVRLIETLCWRVLRLPGASGSVIDGMSVRGRSDKVSSVLTIRFRISWAVRTRRFRPCDYEGRLAFFCLVSSWLVFTYAHQRGYHAAEAM